MIDITRKKCLEQNCNKNPRFNLINKKSGLYCKEHKKENMIDIITRRCLDKNCNKQPTFNLPDKKSGFYCAEHKKENMVNVSSTCLEKNCYKRPTFGINKPIYCKEHSKENMIDVKSKRRCKEEKCDKQQPKFNFPNKQGVYCNEHKKDGMINVTRNYCKCGLQAKYTKYKGYCFKCYSNLFPDEKQVRLFKIKENHIMNFINLHYSNKKCIFDKQLPNLLRPDCYIDKGDYGIITEADEHQHKHILKDDEHDRMERIQNVINKPIIFIRFNPDNYTLNNKKIMSSFKVNKDTNKLEIRNEKEWNNRLNELKNLMDFYLTTKPNEDLTVKYLFYNN